MKWWACNSNATAHRPVVKSEAVIGKLTGRREKNLNIEKFKVKIIEQYGTRPLCNAIFVLRHDSEVF